MTVSTPNITLFNLSQNIIPRLMPKCLSYTELFLRAIPMIKLENSPVWIAAIDTNLITQIIEKLLSLFFSLTGLISLLASSLFL